MPKSNPARGIHTSSPPPPVRTAQGYHRHLPPRSSLRSSRHGPSRPSFRLRQERAAAPAGREEGDDRDGRLLAGEDAAQALRLGLDEPGSPEGRGVDAEDRTPGLRPRLKDEALLLADPRLERFGRGAQERGRQD